MVQENNSFSNTISASPAIDSGSTDNAKTRIVIVYKRHAQPDEQILTLLEKELRAQNLDVFIDRHLTVGVKWAQELENRLRNADVVIPLLSPISVTSDMLSYEIETANEAAHSQGGSPRILPIRINFEDPLPPTLGAILDPIQYAFWSGPEGDQPLVREILSSIENPPARKIDRRKFEPPGGAVPLDSRFYIERPADAEFMAAVERRDSIVLVKGARQMGKTSLLARGLQLARKQGDKVVLTDFQSLNNAHFDSLESFYLALAHMIADQLDLDVLPDDVWHAGRGASVNFQRYIRKEILSTTTRHLVWGLDEVDRLFSCPFGSEVFGLFRSWHNARELNPEGPWKHLTMAIAYATEAHLFISDLNQSPFNVGTRLTVGDFTLDQVAELNRRYDSPRPLQDHSEIQAFCRLLGGQPYLVRKGMHELTSDGAKLYSFRNTADRDEGPYGDHLRRFLMLLAKDDDLSDLMREILRGHPCSSAKGFYRLRSAGLLSGDSNLDASVRCQLYATYFTRHLL